MSKTWYFILSILAIVILAAATVFYLSNRSTKSSSRRQAVFLTNGQVYFGYVENPYKDVVRIKNIYYLKTQDLLTQNDTTDEKKKISLVKLGNELHGPTDEMLISRYQILFIEDMRDNSKINDAIEKFSKSGQPSSQAVD